MNRAIAAAFAAAIVLLGAGTVLAQTPGPTATVSPGQTRAGAQVTVRLEGWPDGAVTASVCGNAARRGTQDCDLAHAQGVGVTAGPPTVFAMKVVNPPATCPCVIRVASAGNEHVVTVPIVVDGVPTGPIVGPDPPASKRLLVSAALRSGGGSTADRFRSALGGRTRRWLVLTLRNRAETPLDALTVTGAVGRDLQGGGPVQFPSLDPIDPGQSRTVTVPISLPAPAWGRYVVYGAVRVGGSPVSFDAATTTMPWALPVVLAFFVGDIAAMIVIRSRARTPVPST